jgi:hypothetical protein
MICKRTVTITLLILSFNIPKAQDIQFYKEDIDFVVKNNYFEVNGIYYFCNVNNRKTKIDLFYPFATDSLNYGDVDSIKVTKKDADIHFIRKDNQGIYFLLEMDPYGTSEYYISYRQKILGNKAEYILMTTSKWNKPLERVNYRLILFNEIKPAYLSYKPDSFKIINGQTIYYWQRKDFMPDKNLIFEFNNIGN